MWKRLSEKTVVFLRSIKMMNIHDSFLVKNTVSILERMFMFLNLKELYTVFKDKHPGLKISFSKFASRRPKWCITVGAKGTHSVSVCTAHQNVKLLLSSVNLSKDYHELLELRPLLAESQVTVQREHL